jgi:hypothetical protein
MKNSYRGENFNTARKIYSLTAIIPLALIPLNSSVFAFISSAVAFYFLFSLPMVIFIYLFMYLCIYLFAWQNWGLNSGPQLRASCLLGRPHEPAIFCFGYF